MDYFEANVRLAVDSTGAAWIASLQLPTAVPWAVDLEPGTDSWVRLARIAGASPAVEVTEARAMLGGTADPFDVVGLSGGGAMLLWLGGQGGEMGAAMPKTVQVRRIGP